MIKEFPLNTIVENAEKWNIYCADLDSFKIWVENDFSLSKARKICKEKNKELGYFHLYFGQATISAIANKLYQRINIVPKFNENDEIYDNYSFMDYKFIDVLDTQYRVVFTKVIENKFSGVLYNYLKKKLEKVIVLENQNGEWKEVNNKWAREYRQSMKLLDKLIV
jgi:hypothetical protein